jgi:hypothetical protein
MVTCAQYVHVCSIWSRVLNKVTCAQYDHVCSIWSRVLNMVTCTQYDHVCSIWSRVLNMITCAQSICFTVLSNARALWEPLVSCWEKKGGHGGGGGGGDGGEVVNGAEALRQSILRGTSWEFQHAWYVQRDVTSNRVRAGSQKSSWVSLDYSTGELKIHSAENIK